MAMLPPTCLLLAAASCRLATPPYAPLSRPPAFSTATLGGMHWQGAGGLSASQQNALALFSRAAALADPDAIDVLRECLADRVPVPCSRCGCTAPPALDLVPCPGCEGGAWYCRGIVEGVWKRATFPQAQCRTRERGERQCAALEFDKCVGRRCGPRTWRKRRRVLRGA